MNRIVTCIILLNSAINLLGQDSLGNEIKVSSGEKTLELQLSPFGDSPINLNGIRGRWFSSDTKAFRLNFFLGYDSDTRITQQEDDFGLKELKDRTSVFTLSVRPGFENHILVSKRLSPYFGMEFDITYQTSGFRSELQLGSDVNYVKTINNNGFVRIGANAIAGMDYYIAKKLYVGTELGFGFNYTEFLAVKVKSNQIGFDEPDPVKQGSSLDIGPNVVAQIRLGYAF